MHYEGTSTKQVPVHKKDAEGVLLIDAITGHVVTEQHDRPEWATGLVLAQLAERHQWYSSRLGHLYTSQMATPDMLAYEDLGWCKMDAVLDADGAQIDTEEAYHDADDNFRMEVLAAVTGVNLNTTDIEEGLAGAGPFAVEVELMQDNLRTDAEMEDLRIAQAGRFDAVEGEQKTGTHN